LPRFDGTVPKPSATSSADSVAGVSSSAGDALLDPSATRRLIEAYTSGGADHAGATTLPEELTPRELELLALIATGSTNAEIAERLVISTLTVKSHVSRILAKTSARDRTQLVVMAYESGLVGPGAA
jgi:DNA-binding NarL/FixJ family response regulator